MSVSSFTVKFDTTFQSATLGRFGATAEGGRKVDIPSAPSDMSRKQAIARLDGDQLVVRAGGQNPLVVGKFVHQTDPEPIVLHPGDLILMDGYQL